MSKPEILTSPAGGETPVDLKQLARDDLVDTTVRRILDLADEQYLPLEALISPGATKLHSGASAVSILLRSATGTVDFIIDGEGSIWMAESVGHSVEPIVTLVDVWDPSEYLARRCIEVLSGYRPFRPSVH